MRRALVFMWLGVVACDAQRKPCAVDADCFLGEACVDRACVLEEPTADASVDEGTPDMPPEGDCRVTPGLCGTFPCNTRSGDCIRCELDQQCGEKGVCVEDGGGCVCEAGFHWCTNRCVSDDKVDSCGGRCTPCPGTSNGYATCEAQVCGLACNPGWLVCDDSCVDGAPHCVECLSAGDCPATDPVCENNACGPCRNDGDCTSKTGLPVCFEGECVACTEEKRDACNGRTCSPATHTCTTNLAGSIDECEVCLADADCALGSVCVPMFFNGAMRPNHYCLPVRDAQNPCYKGYQTPESKTTINGKGPLVVCSINEPIATCEAFKQYGDLCDKDEDCGTPELNDGLCKPFLGEYRCTFACVTTFDCPSVETATCVSYCRDNN